MAVPSRVYPLYQALWRPLFAPISSGTNIFSRSWDLLIIIDGCRTDVIREVELPVGAEVTSIRSVGSQSKEWLAKSFVPEFADSIANTSYLTANVFTDEVFGESQNDRRTNPANWETVTRDQIGRLIELWRSDWDDTLDTVPPRVVTDAAITVARDAQPDRMIVHYMQPHEPFIAGEEPIRNVWGKIRTGELAKDVAWEAYLENLRLVLSEVEMLLENMNAPRTVITSDHGNAFGEWGIYGHPIGFQHPVVKRVPWIETTAQDTERHSPDWECSHGTTDQGDIDERLAALGYL